MPAYQSLWFDDDQGLFPIAEARPEDETDTGGVVQSSRLGLSLLIEGQLLSQEQDLRAQGCARAEQETEEKKYVPGQISDQLAENPVSALRSEGIETWAVRIAHGQSGRESSARRGWLLGFSSAANPNK